MGGSGCGSAQSMFICSAPLCGRDEEEFVRVMYDFTSAVSSRWLGYECQWNANPFALRRIIRKL